MSLRLLESILLVWDFSRNVGFTELPSLDEGRRGVDLMCTAPQNIARTMQQKKTCFKIHVRYGLGCWGWMDLPDLRTVGNTAGVYWECKVFKTPEATSDLIWPAVWIQVLSESRSLTLRFTHSLSVSVFLFRHVAHCLCCVCMHVYACACFY